LIAELTAMMGLLLQCRGVRGSIHYHLIKEDFMSKKLTPTDEKMTYEKPAVIHRQVMESIAGACEEADPNNGKTGVNDMCTTINS
jgi:hypothetical protein